MADISMCLSAECPSFNQCHRAQAQPNPLWQSYIPYQPDIRLGKCVSFLDAREYHNLV